MCEGKHARECACAYVADGRRDDHVISGLPVRRGDHLLAVGELQGIDDADDLIEVAAAAANNVRRGK